MQWVDWGILSIIGLSILTGLFRGFIKELIALCVWALAVWLSYHYADNIFPLLEPYVKDETVRKGLSYLIIVFSVLLVGGIANALLGFMIKQSGLSGTDRSLGMLFGLVRGVFIVAIAMIAVQMTSLPYKTYAKESKLYAHFEPMVNWLDGYMPEFIKQVKAVDTAHQLSDLESTLVLLDN